MEVTGTAQREAWLERRLPPVEEVRPDLFSIPLPNATSGIRYVYCYAFLHPDDGGVTIVDPGWRDRDSYDALTDGLAVAGRSVGDVRQIVVTHFHPDHLGLADVVAEKSGAPVLMHRAELPSLPAAVGDVRLSIEETEPYLSRHGLPPDEIAFYRRDDEGMRAYTELRRPTGFLEDGEWLDVPGRRIRAVRTPGHTPGHLCLHLPDERLLLSGDHLLPRITPNVSAFPRSGRNPLADYLASLRVTADLTADEVLPAHEYRFTGLADRVEAILRHHDEREEELMSVLDEAPGPLSAAEVSRLLRWSRPFQDISLAMRRSALAESLAHLLYLEGEGRVVRLEDGTACRWAAAG